MKEYNRSEFLGLSLAGLATFAGCAKTEDLEEVVESVKVEKNDQLIQLSHKYEDFNGVVLVVENGKEIYKKAFGLANREWGIPHTTDTKFRVASITKQFTALLTMQLVEEGKIELNEQITTYIPEFRKDTDSKITVHHLLSISSGLPRIEELGQRDEFIEEFCSQDLLQEPGLGYMYGNANYILLGIIIENVTGKSFEEVLQEKILTPLNMKDSGIFRYEKVLKKMATGYTEFSTGYKKDPTPPGWVSLFSAGAAPGGMYSTLDDLFIWDQALYTDQLISQKYKDIYLKPHAPAEWQYVPFEGMSYAYGWFTSEIPIENKNGEKNVRVFYHGGLWGGFRSAITRLVDDHHLILLLSNNNRANGLEYYRKMSQMSKAIIHILYDQPYALLQKQQK